MKAQLTATGTSSASTAPERHSLQMLLVPSERVQCVRLLYRTETMSSIRDFHQAKTIRLAS